jgi:hypothetical protein
VKVRGVQRAAAKRASFLVHLIGQILIDAEKNP